MKIFQRADYTATFPLCTTLLPWYCQSLILVLPTSVLMQVVRLCHLPLPSSSISRQAVSGIASVSRPKHSRIILPGDRYIATENELDMVGRSLLHHSSPGRYPHAAHVWQHDISNIVATACYCVSGQKPCTSASVPEIPSATVTSPL